MASVFKKLIRRPEPRNGSHDVIQDPERRSVPQERNLTDRVKAVNMSDEGEKGKGSDTNLTDSAKSKAAAQSGPSKAHTLQVRTKRLMKEFHDVQRRCDKDVFTAELVNDNLYEWHIKLFRIDPDSALHKDMAELGSKHISLSLSFPENFPFSPPFMRVLSPRIEGGFVLDGGAICMELLTPKGWSSAYTVEAIVLQFSAAVVKGKGRIDRKNNKDFSKKDAEAAYKRLVKTHEKYGWVTPPKAEG